MNIRSFYLNPHGVIEKDLSPERLTEARSDTDGLLWLDIYDPEREAGDFLLEEMKFHPLAVGDLLDPSHQPAKVDDFGDHLFLIVHGIDYSSQQEFVETARLSMFITAGTVVTLHRVSVFSVDHVIDRIERDPRLMERPADLFAYNILDALHDNILPALDHLAEVAGRLEEEAIAAPGRSVLQNILLLKRSAIRIQRTLSPQTRVFNRLSRNEFSLISGQAAPYFRDLHDQTIQLDVINTGVRDTADNALANYLSSIGIKQNETMRILAIVAAVFLPLTLIAGIYGMNFKYQPDLEWRWGYFAVLGVMGTVGLLTFYYLFVRRLNWKLQTGARIVRSVKPDLSQMRNIPLGINSIVDVTGSVTRSIASNVSDIASGRKNQRDES
jgi:magnesium transporter